MKTESPTPDHDELKALLANSFHSEEADGVPALPDDLRERIRDQYGEIRTPSQIPTEERSESFFAKLSLLFAQPAFSGAAAVILLMAVAAVLFFPRDEIRRGGDDHPTPPAGAKIVLYGFDAERAKAIAKEFEPESVKIVSDLAGQISPEGRTIIIDGADGEIEGYNGPGTTALIKPLPEDPADIILKVQQLANELKAGD